MNVGYKIKKLRENRKLSQPDLAELLGISQTSLSHIENGVVKKLDFLLMDKICKEFEVDFDYFIEDKQINNVDKNEGGVVGCNNGTINNFPENIIEQLKILIEENKNLKQENAILKKKS
jgi:transcriptional regulator with XRE-family HTH domain